MTPSPINEALHMVQQVRRSLAHKEPFKGWSGPIRILCGTLAVFVAAVLHLEWIPRTVFWHVVSWGCLFAVAMLLNLGALFHWFANDEKTGRDVRRLRPLLDVFLPLLVGAVLTFALITHRQFDYLFGVWMCMFGLTNLASHYVLPGPILLVGLFYVLAGCICLLMPGMNFLDPWPMGWVFFGGEWAGGLVLYLDDRRYATFEKYMDSFKELPDEETDDE